MESAVVVWRYIAGGALVVLGLIVFYRDGAARARRGKLINPKWPALVALKNEGTGWGFWIGMAAVLGGILLLPI